MEQDTFITSIFPWPSANHECTQLLLQATTLGQLRLLSGLLFQPQTWSESALHLRKDFFNLDKLSNLQHKSCSDGRGSLELPW